MPKVIFELTDYSETPKGEKKLNIEIKFEPMKRDKNSKAQELADVLIEAIDRFRIKSQASVDNVELKKY